MKIGDYGENKADFPEKKGQIKGMENWRCIPQMKREKVKGKVRERRMKIESLCGDYINSPVNE
jgi:hypothetical protein